MTPRWKQVVGTTLLALFATYVAAFSHLAGGGALPSPAVLAACVALSTLVCLGLAGRKLSLWRTAASVGLSQLLFHALFAGTTVTGAITAGGAHRSGGTLEMPAHGGMDVAELLLPSGTPPADHSAWMWLAHLAAAVMTVLIVRNAESTVRTVRNCAVLLFAVLAMHLPVRVPITVDPRLSRSRFSRTRLPRDLRVLFSITRHRGPPLSCA